MENIDQNGFSVIQINQFMTLALKQAQKAFQEQQVPVGCIFVKINLQKKEVIAKSHNLTNKFKNATRHCQINCMYELQNLPQEQRKKLILFVTVEPCIMCSYALNIFGVNFVYFGQFNDKFGGCGSVLKCNQYKFRGGIMQKQSLQLIKKFYQRGNIRISQQMRNKKRKKAKLQYNESKQLTQKDKQ